MSAQPSAVSRSFAMLGDGSATFFASRQQFPDRNLNYRALDRIIRDYVGETPSARMILYSSIEPANEKQLKFVEFIEEHLCWSVHKISPYDAMVCNPLLTDGVFRHIRFDSWIAYALGRLGGKPDIDRIVIISDSWPLSGPVLDCAARGTAITICFFGSLIDTRWHRVFRERRSDGAIDFLDLDEHTESLFDRAKPARGKEGYRQNLLD